MNFTKRSTAPSVPECHKVDPLSLDHITGAHKILRVSDLRGTARRSTGSLTIIGHNNNATVCTYCNNDLGPVIGSGAQILIFTIYIS
jgi:hypothetical protein